MLALGGAAMHAKVHDRVDQEQEREQLQQQQDVLPQPLEQCVHMQVFDALLPEKGARHAERLALELKEIEQDHQHRNQQED